MSGKQNQDLYQELGKSSRDSSNQQTVQVNKHSK